MRHAFALVLVGLSLTVSAAAEGLDRPAEPPPESQRLQPHELQTLAILVRDLATARRLGTIAEGRAADSRVSGLSAAMAQGNGELARGLEETAGPENVPIRERLRYRDVQRFETLASDRSIMEHELVSWVTAHYPAMIESLEKLGREDQRFAAAAQSGLPVLRGHLNAALTLTRE